MMKTSTVYRRVMWSLGPVLSLTLTGCWPFSSGKSSSNSGSGTSGLSVAATYTRPGTRISITIYNDPAINATFSQTQLAEMELILSTLPASQLSGINWIVAFTPGSSSTHQPTAGQGLIVSATGTPEYIYSGMVAQIGTNLFANNEEVGTQAQWQQLLEPPVSSSDAESDFGGWYELWVENSSQAMDDFENDYLEEDDVVGIEAILFIMAQFFNADGTLNVYGTGPDVITNGFYAGSEWTTSQITPMQITRTATGFTIPAIPYYPTGSYPITLNFDSTGKEIVSYTLPNGYTSPLATPVQIPAPFLSELDAIPLSPAVPASAATAASSQVSATSVVSAISNGSTGNIGGTQPLRVTSPLAPNASYIPLKTPAGEQVLNQMQGLIMDSAHQPLSEQQTILPSAHSVTPANGIAPSGQ